MPRTPETPMAIKYNADKGRGGLPHPYITLYMR